MTTDNTSYAPLLLHPNYVNGGTLYWRVAAMDENRNVGEFAPPQKINIAQRLRMTVTGQPRRRRWARVTVAVTDPAASSRSVPPPCASPGQASALARRAPTRKGRVTFRLRVTKKGRLSFSATKAGFAAGGASIRVR